MERLNQWIKWIYTVIFLCIFILCICFGSIVFPFQKKLDNIVFSIIGIFIIYLLTKLLQCFSYNDRIDKYMFWVAIFTTFFLYFISYQYCFKTGWDPGIVMDNAFYLVQHNERELVNYSWYYKTYPNNVLITTLFTSAYYLAQLIGKTNGYFILLFYQSIIFSWSGYFLFRTARLVIKDIQYCILVWVIYSIFIGLSPWITVPYSDSFGLGMVTLIMFCCAGYYFDHDNLKERYLFILAFLSVLGFYIKPQIFIFFIAFCIVSLLSAGIKILKLNSQKIRQIIIVLIAIVIAYIIVLFCMKYSGLTLDNESKVGIPHYLMMGLNESSNGGWNGNDIEFSQSFNSYKERCAANLHVAKERIYDMGFLRLLKLWIRKTILNYNDGTFGWAGEGEFYNEVYTVGIPSIRNMLSKFYETPHQYFYWWVQSLWMGILLLNAVSFRCKHENTINTIKLSILGLTLFEMLFEARARYLFCYASCYIFIAVIAMRNIVGYKNKKMKYPTSIH